MKRGAAHSMIGLYPVRDVTEETATLTRRIHALLDEPVESARGSLLQRLEDTLTDGYARALTLEARRDRLRHRITELAAELGPGSASTDQLAELARELFSTSVVLDSLRELLAELRGRARQVRVA